MGVTMHVNSIVQQIKKSSKEILSKKKAFSLNKLVYWENQNYQPLGVVFLDNAYLSKGTFREVFMAIDIGLGEFLVVKKFHKKYVYNKSDWHEDLKGSYLARKCADAFNSVVKTNKPIKFVLPRLDRAKYTRDVYRQNELVILEPFLGDNYQKFSSNSGYIYKEYGFSMEAFSHFSYHYSKGEYLICDLQGVKTEDNYLLTDPCFCSNTGQKFGATDLGMKGIDNFFLSHTCNILCKSKWIKPAKLNNNNLDVSLGTTRLLKIKKNANCIIY